MKLAGQFFLAFCIVVLASSISFAQFAEPSTPGGNGVDSDVFGQHSGRPAASEQLRSGGLGVLVLFAGRNNSEKSTGFLGSTLTISAELKNVSDQPIYVALIGPEPGAVDSSGVSYDIQKISGLGQCYSLRNGDIDRCMSNYRGMLPGSVFSLLQPNASAILAITFSAKRQSTADFISVTMNVALAEGTRPSNDADRKLENVTVSFPVIPISESEKSNE